MNIEGMPWSNMPEFVGTALLDTIGLVISGIDDELHAKIGLPDDMHAVGVISSRTGAAGQIVAVDEAVKNTSAKLISVDLPRDTKGWGGHGNYIVVSAKDTSDAREAVEIALELTNKHAGEVYISDAGHLEFAYSARAGEVINRVFDTPMGQAFGFMAGSPAAIGLVMADAALKAGSIKVTKYMTPSIGTSHSNEVIIAFTGDASAVKTAVLRGREVGMNLLLSMGSTPLSPGESFLSE